MKLESLRLRNFRNFSEQEFLPDEHLNFLVGENAQGKTSLLEAIYLISTLRSFRTRQLKDLVKNHQEFSSVEGRLQETDENIQNWRSSIRVDLKTILEERVQRTILMNDKKLARLQDYTKLGIHAVVFQPTDHELIRGEPSLRREYIDHVLSAEQRGLYELQRQYAKVLQHKNQLLKMQREQPSLALRESLEAFNTQLVELGSKIIFERSKWLIRVKNQLNNTLHKIAPDQLPVHLSYFSTTVLKEDRNPFNFKNLFLETFAGQDRLVSIEMIKESFSHKLRHVMSREAAAGISLVGPHRDDWMLSFETKTLKAAGSQGEIRTVLLSLKLAEIALFRESTGTRPLLVIDDFSSELDSTRRNFLMDFLEQTDLQVFISSTEKISSPKCRVFKVQNHQLQTLEPTYGPTRAESTKSQQLHS